MMMPTTPTANSVVTPAAPESPVDVTVATPPRANTIVQPQVAADVVIGVAPPDGSATVPGNDTMLVSENDGAAEPMRAELTTEQRRFIAGRKVSLLLKVDKGEITPEAALREAEKLPERKGKKSIAGSR